MRCIICDSTDQWENVDEYRMKKMHLSGKEMVPINMCVCKKCGFVSYPSFWKSEEELREYYRKEYRKPPTINNLYSGQRKIHFHNVFLQDVFKEWAEKNIKPNVYEVGAAYGMALHWFKQTVPGSTVGGTELTKSFRKNAFYEFGIKLTEDFDYSGKYDLIMSYKVAEHQLDADKYLRKYVECLNPEGFFYISVPIWFDMLINFGLGGFDLEYYYDKNHVNVWTLKNFKNLLAKVGLEIIKEDHYLYDSTFLCKRNDSLMSAVPEFEKAEDIKEKMARIKGSYLAFTENKFDDAILLWPNYPIAHISRMELNRRDWFAKGWEWMRDNPIAEAFKSCNNAVEIYLAAAEISMRFGKFNEAIAYCEDGLKKRPENPAGLLQLVHIMREMALHAESIDERYHFFNEARKISAHLRNVSIQHLRESHEFIYNFNSQLPAPEELTFASPT